MSKRFKVSSSPVFKPYYQNDAMLLPPRLDELIPANHLVRVVNGLLDKIDISLLIGSYQGGGTSSYHPLMLLKVVLYGYIDKIYSSRQIAKALRENVHFMWLSGMSQPDFRTINNFRSGRLKPCIDELFVSILMMLMESGYVDLKEYFVDGSKFLANAGKYSYVWKKNTLRYKEQLGEKIASLLSYIDEVVEEENRSYGEKDLAEMGEGANLDGDEVDRTLKEINGSLQEKLSAAGPTGSSKKPGCRDTDSSPLPPEELARDSRALQKKLEAIDEQLRGFDTPEAGRAEKASQRIKDKLLPKLEGYEQQESLAGERSGYSKTDPDATFFRFKNSELLPAYNVMVGTQGQFILNYSVHQNPADASCFIPHMENLKEIANLTPGLAVGDSGFGSEENYHYLAGEGIKNYLKYNRFHQDEKGGSKNPFHRDKFQYDAEKDVFICPQGRELSYVESREVKTGSGYARNIRIYESPDCGGCAYAGQCKKGKGGRTLYHSPRFEEYKAQARVNLKSGQGIWLRKKRSVDVETVFGHLKFNKKYRRFLLRGKEKVSIEFGLLSIAHNLEKMGRMMMANAPA